jgi:hypothetical protein
MIVNALEILLSQLTCAAKTIPNKTSVTITMVRPNGIGTFGIWMTCA